MAESVVCGTACTSTSGYAEFAAWAAVASCTSSVPTGHDTPTPCMSGWIMGMRQLRTRAHISCPILPDASCERLHASCPMPLSPLAPRVLTGTGRTKAVLPRTLYESERACSGDWRIERRSLSRSDGELTS